jgi:hypothetical protein
MINVGDWLSDYKAKMFYRVIETGKVSGKTVVLCETFVNKTSSRVGYEVIILDHGDIVPPSESWGETAWSWCTAEQAKRAFDEIIKRGAEIMQETPCA